MLQEIQIGDMDSNFRKLVGTPAFGHEILIKSGHEPIARIIPFRKERGMTAIDVMSDIYGILSDDAAENWHEDSRLQHRLTEVQDPWAS